MQELKLNEITVKSGEINVKKELANAILANAIDVANVIDDTEVNESNIKEVKKKLAQAKKVLKGLNDKKLEIKKEYMAPYTKFETLIKEAKEIIDSAETELRNKTKEIEEKDRMDKLSQIQTLFESEVENYNLQDLVSFEDWFKKEFLNKTFTMKKVNEDLQIWLQKIWNDAQVIKGMSHSADILTEYLQMNDANINDAKMIAEERIAKVKKVKKWLNEN